MRVQSPHLTRRLFISGITIAPHFCDRRAFHLRPRDGSVNGEIYRVPRVHATTAYAVHVYMRDRRRIASAGAVCVHLLRTRRRHAAARREERFV